MCSAFLRYATPLLMSRQPSDSFFTCQNHTITFCPLIFFLKHFYGEIEETWRIKVKSLKNTNFPSAIKKCILEISWYLRKHRVLETTNPRRFCSSRALIADITKLTFELWNSSFGILAMLVMTASSPHMKYTNLLMKQMDAATDAFFIEERLAARLPATERAKSFWPCCHKEKAYTCKPSSSSTPWTTYHTNV